MRKALALGLLVAAAWIVAADAVDSWVVRVTQQPPIPPTTYVAPVLLGSGTPDGTKFLRDDNVWTTPSGGSDPWTYVSLGSDFTTSSASNTNVTGLAFTPAASTTYEIHGKFLLRTATATVGPRPGVSWPTGYSDGSAWWTAPTSNTAFVSRLQPPTSTQNAAGTGLPTTTDSYLATLDGLLIMGGSPSGTFQVTLTTETAATNVTMRAGSFLRYRTVP